MKDQIPILFGRIVDRKWAGKEYRLYSPTLSNKPSKRHFARFGLSDGTAVQLRQCADAHFGQFFRIRWLPTIKETPEL